MLQYFAIMYLCYFVQWYAKWRKNIPEKQTISIFSLYVYWNFFLKIFMVAITYILNAEVKRCIFLLIKNPNQKGQLNLIYIRYIWSLVIKLHIFWEGHKNLPLTFDWHYTKLRWRFRNILWPSQNIWTLLEQKLNLI